MDGVLVEGKSRAFFGGGRGQGHGVNDGASQRAWAKKKPSVELTAGWWIGLRRSGRKQAAIHYAPPPAGVWAPLQAAAAAASLAAEEGFLGAGLAAALGATAGSA